jgi:phosphoribosylamine--glycine ligase
MGKEGMRVLIVGSGAREHALAWAAARSPRVRSVLTAPGNAGTARLGRNVPVDPMDLPALAAAARRHEVDLAIVGPDDPLAAGAVDALQAAGIRAFGPTRAAAQIEASKVWAKQFMARHGIPTAQFEVFVDARQAHRFVETRPATWDRLVVKADGLARGKGAIVCDSDADAHEAIAAIMERRIFGPAGERVVIEQRLEGPEASVFALCAGETALPMGAARDHKRIFDGDRGPNTGGMGAYSPTRLVPPPVLDDVMARIVRPTVAGLAAEGRPFVGFLYAGLMFTADGPHVLEFNARFGDPEAQAILPLLKTDLIEAVDAALNGRLADLTLRWRDGYSCAVCLASAGYPDTVDDGKVLSGLDSLDPDVLVFHAGTIERDGRLVTRGGRILTIVGLGPTLAAARDAAYGNVRRIHFDGMQYRRDIGEREA